MREIIRKKKMYKRESKKKSSEKKISVQIASVSSDFTQKILERKL